MESEVIVYSFLAAGFISLICFGVFIWMNVKDRSSDEQIYKDKTDPRSLVSKYKHVGLIDEDAINPVHSLKKYAVSGKKSTPTRELSTQEINEANSITVDPDDNSQESEKNLDSKDDSRFAPPSSQEAMGTVPSVPKKS